MTSRERVAKLLRGEHPDRIAVLPGIGDHAGWVNGLTMDIIYHDAKKAADAQVNALREYGYDVVTVQVEPSWPVAEACGCSVTYPPDKCPWITDRAIKGPADVDRMGIPDFMAHAATRTIIEATALLREAVGNEVMVAGYMSGPLTFALQLVAYNDFIIKTRKDPPFTEALVHKAAQVATAFARALKDAGAEMLVVCEHDLQLLSPELGEKYLLPGLPEICSVFEHTILHTCGRVAAHHVQLADAVCALPHLDFISFSCDISIPKMIEIYGNRMGICGNIDHIHLLPSGTPEEVQESCRAAIDEGMKARAFFLSPGCELTIDTPPANVKAFVRSAELYGRYA
ncbi:MAG: uroporphyrinogen decarboxylase family protein [Thermodesulfovibrionales bacterium]